MTANLTPYLNFRDTAREAMEFYRSVFGGELDLRTFSELEASEDPSEADKVMHSQLSIPGGLTLMGADVPNSMAYDGNHAQIALSGDAADDATLRGWWERLSDGAKILEPLTTAPWGDAFGMLVDKHGTTWLVNIAGEGEGNAA